MTLGRVLKRITEMGIGHDFGICNVNPGETLLLLFQMTSARLSPLFAAAFCVNVKIVTLVFISVYPLFSFFNWLFMSNVIVVILKVHVEVDPVRVLSPAPPPSVSDYTQNNSCKLAPLVWRCTFACVLFFFFFFLRHWENLAPPVRHAQTHSLTMGTWNTC